MFRNRYNTLICMITQHLRGNVKILRVVRLEISEIWVWTWFFGGRVQVTHAWTASAFFFFFFLPSVLVPCFLGHFLCYFFFCLPLNLDTKRSRIDFSLLSQLRQRAWRRRDLHCSGKRKKEKRAGFSKWIRIFFPIQIWGMLAKKNKNEKKEKKKRRRFLTDISGATTSLASAC